MNAPIKSPLRNGNKSDVIAIVFLLRNLLKLSQLIIIVDLPFAVVVFFAFAFLLLLFTTNIIIQRYNQFDFYVCTAMLIHSITPLTRMMCMVHWYTLKLNSCRYWALTHTHSDSKLLWLYRLERHERWKSAEIDFDECSTRTIRCKSSEEAGWANGQSNKCSFWNAYGENDVNFFFRLLFFMKSEHTHTLTYTARVLPIFTCDHHKWTHYFIIQS